MQFVYPFTLEPHILTVESSRRTTMMAHAARREALLRARDDEKERKRREALRRIAPGFEPTGSVLVPTRTGSFQRTDSAPVSSLPVESTHQRTRSVMDDLVDQLAAMDSSAGTSNPTS